MPMVSKNKDSNIWSGTGKPKNCQTLGSMLFDIYVDVSNGQIYYKSSNGWVLLFAVSEDNALLLLLKKQIQNQQKSINNISKQVANGNLSLQQVQQQLNEVSAEQTAAIANLQTQIDLLNSLVP